MTRKTRIILFSVLSVLIVAFIYSNSLPSIPESRETSLSVAALLRPLLDPHHRLDDDVYHNLVRKLAHLTEFGALGMSLTALSAQFPRKKRYLLGTPLAAAAVVALTDEGLQFFTGRGNSMRDVCIDIGGAVCGIAVVALILRLQKERKK